MDRNRTGRAESAGGRTGGAGRNSHVCGYLWNHSGRGSAFVKRAQLGTVLSFMMAVTTLSLPSLIMLRKAIKPLLMAVFIGICTVGIVLVGHLFNGVQSYLI